MSFISPSKKQEIQKKKKKKPQAAVTNMLLKDFLAKIYLCILTIYAKNNSQVRFFCLFFFTFITIYYLLFYIFKFLFI